MSTVWEQSTKSNISKFEAVQGQRRSTHFGNGDCRRTSSVTTVQQQMRWVEHQTRKQHCTPTFGNPNSTVFPQHGNQTRGHASRFLRPYSTVNTYRSFFFPSVIRLWHSLPVTLIDASSLEKLQMKIAGEME